MTRMEEEIPEVPYNCEILPVYHPQSGQEAVIRAKSKKEALLQLEDYLGEIEIDEWAIELMPAKNDEAGILLTNGW